ncbi:MAG: PAC2 family protein [Acidimicrobiia bacterium]
MDPVRRFDRPALRSPQALVAFEGWNDACDAASGAAAFLLGQFEADPFAVIDPEGFYDFQSRRPVVEVDEGGTRSLTWPVTRYFALEMQDAARDLVVVVGEEPHLQWKTFTRLVTQVLAETDVEQVVTLGAFIGQVAHTVPVPIIGVATDPQLVREHALLSSRYEGPTGIVGVLLEACREVGIPAISLWAATPHYLAANPNPKAMLALLTKASEVLEIEVDTAELDKVTSEFEARVDAAMGESEEFTQYVQRLEKEAEASPQATVDPGASQQLISEIEQFLRDHDD